MAAVLHKTSEITHLFQRARWVFFDLGNTLVDQEPAIHDRIHRILLAAHKLGDAGLSTEAVYDGIVTASASFAEWPLVAALETCGMARDQSNELGRSVKYDPTAERLYPSAKAVLQNCSQHFELGYIANQLPGLEQRLAKLEILPYFKMGLSSATVPFRKPQPEIFLEALRKAACAASRAVMVGDRIDNDILPAKRLGMRTVRIIQGYSRLQTPRCKAEVPDLTLGGLDEFLDLLW